MNQGGLVATRPADDYYPIKISRGARVKILVRNKSGKPQILDLPEDFCIKNCGLEIEARIVKKGWWEVFVIAFFARLLYDEEFILWLRNITTIKRVFVKL